LVGGRQFPTSLGRTSQGFHPWVCWSRPILGPVPPSE
jgi:hypothetical protein